MDESVPWMIAFKVFATATTIASFLTGIPICVRIYRQRSCHDITGFPFLMGFISGVFWFRYGLLNAEWPVWLVNVTGMPIFAGYIFFYLYFKRAKMWMAVAVVVEMALIVVMLTVVERVPTESAIWCLSWACPILNVLTFGAPLAGILTVVRSRASDSLPLPLCAVNLLVSSEWLIYGALSLHFSIIIPNALGTLLSIFQISLFIALPKVAGEESPATRFARAYKRLLRFGKAATVVSPTTHGDADGLDWLQKSSRKWNNSQTVGATPADVERALRGLSAVGIPVELAGGDGDDVSATPPSSTAPAAADSARHSQLRRYRSLE